MYGAEKKKKPMSRKKLKKILTTEQQRLHQEAVRAEEVELSRQRVEQRKREEAAARAQAEAQAQAEQEQHRLTEQSHEDVPFVSMRQEELVQLEHEIYQQTEWDKYLACNPLPDVQCPSSLNTYLSMYRAEIDYDDTTVNSSSQHSQHQQQMANIVSGGSAPDVALAPVIEACATTERVVDRLLQVNASAREILDFRQSSQCWTYIATLRRISQHKLDTLTAAFLSRADEYEDHEAKVMSKCYHTSDVGFGLWVHTSAKHGRVKRIEFPKIGFTIELPVALQKSRTSIRVIRTLYDDVSCAPVPSFDTDPLENDTNIASGVNSRLARLAGITQEEMNAAAKRLRTTMSQQEEIKEKGKADKKEPTNTNTATSSVSASAAATAATPVKLSQLHFVSVGGIVNVEQLVLPPPIKKAKGWTMREITPLSKTIAINPYPSTSTSGATEDPATSASAALSQAPLRATYRIPDYIFLDEREPHFGWWDGKHMCWRTEGVALTKYDAKRRIVNLSLNTLKPFAIIQPRALDFPYRHWSLQPTCSNTLELKLLGSRFEVVLSIGTHGHAHLISPADPVLSELTHPHTPGVLLTRLSRAGINVMPNREDAIYCRKPFKQITFAETLHQHIALVSSIFDITSNPFNSSHSSTTCIFNIRISRDSPALKQAKIRADAWNAEKQREAGREALFEGPPSPKAESPSSGLQDNTTLGLGDDSIAQQEVRADAAAESEQATMAEDAELSQMNAKQLAELDAMAAQHAAQEKAQQEQQAKASLEERVNRGYQWVTVLASEHKYSLVKGIQPDGTFDDTLLPGTESHVSLRRALFAYFQHCITPDQDLATALLMTQQPTDSSALLLQQTVRRMLNLVQVFTFH